MSDELLEVEEAATMRREEAAERLRAIADQLSRHNKLSFEREGRRYTVDVPAEVTVSVEIEIGDESEIDIEISW